VQGSSSSASGLARFLLRNPWLPIGVAALVIFALWVKSTRTQPHHLRVAFPTAVSLVPGLDVQIDGLDAGAISKVDYRDGNAVVEIGIDKDRWPLRRGTTATIRYGTTVGNGTRRVDLEPGPANAPALAEGGIIAGRAAVAPVELDEVFNMLDKPTRADLQSTLGHTADGLKGHEAELNRGLAASADGLSAVQAFLGDLSQDTYALRGLLVNADRVTRTLGTRQSEISNLVSVAASTFDEFASRSDALKASLVELPPALSSVRTTLKRLDTSVDGLSPLVADLGPGATALRSLAPSARRAVAQLRTQAPIGAAALRSLGDAAPGLNRLLRDATPETKQLETILTKLAPMAACIRPYAPEAAGTLSNWASYTKNYDGIAHYARVKVTASPYSLNATPDFRTDDYIKLLPMIQYAMPRPPGLNAGKPVFLPECGAGPDSLDPSKDPEDTAPGRANAPKAATKNAAASGRGASEQATPRRRTAAQLLAPVLDFLGATGGKR
jgi:virulence factor Mce-like protein